MKYGLVASQLEPVGRQHHWRELYGWRTRGEAAGVAVRNGAQSTFVVIASQVMYKDV